MQHLITNGNSAECELVTVFHIFHTLLKVSTKKLKSWMHQQIWQKTQNKRMSLFFSTFVKNRTVKMIVSVKLNLQIK